VVDAVLIRVARSMPSVPEPHFARVAFGPIVVEYDDRVLAPRAWTMEQSTWAAELAASAPPGPLLELYCGAGHIGLAAAHLSGRRIVQVDDSAHACAWAAHNAERLTIESDVRCAAAERALHPGEHFGVVIADPPYLRSDEVGEYPDDPAHAVDGGPDGLQEIARALRVIAAHTTTGAVSLLQVRGPGQSEAIASLIQRAGLPLRLVETRALSPERALVRLDRLTTPDHTRD